MCICIFAKHPMMAAVYNDRQTTSGMGLCRIYFSRAIQSSAQSCRQPIPCGYDREGATLSPSLARGSFFCGMQFCKIWSTFYSALLGGYASAPHPCQSGYKYTCSIPVSPVSSPSNIFQGLILHLRLSIYRCCLKRVGLVPNPRSLLPQRNFGFPGSLDTVVRAGTAR